MSPGVTVTRAPHGACCSRWRRSAARCSAASPPGATRMLTFALARGMRVFDALAIGVVSMPITVMAGLAHIRCATVPEPISRTPSSRPDSARTHCGPRSTSAALDSCSPATATLPSSSCRLASRRTSTLSASGTTPPHNPECRPWSSVATSTTQSASPRSDTVSAGTSGVQLSESAITITSAASLSLCAASSRPNDGEPDSSSPSTNTVTPTGGVPPCARKAARWVAMPALSSALPRPYSRPSRSVGSNGGEFHCDASPSGWTS